jgi:hypothetical protein
MTWRGKSVEDRLAAGAVVTESGCWEWTRALNGSGYARIHVDGKLRVAHRVAYELLVGPIPEGLFLDHLCRNRRCINPAHLEPVTNRENLHRSPFTVASINASRVTCPRGHAYSDENTYRGPDGNTRVCRQCARDFGRAPRRSA